MSDSSRFERRAMELFAAALDKPADELDAWLSDACAGDEALESRVRELIAADLEAESGLRTGGAATDAAEPEPPEKIGVYRIVRLIGQGGMGAVYEGVREAGDFDHRVAIKVVRPGPMSDVLYERFQHERQTLARLNHAHVGRLYDGGELPDGSPYFVMEYVDGESLIDWADNHDLSLEARLDLFADVCAAVQYAHQNLIVHRDITPGNVLVDTGGVAKLIDFGISRPSDESSETSAQAAAGKMSFTPGFAAPERARGEAATTLSDIYSLGRLLAALLEGESLDDDLRAIIARASAEDPSDRYPAVDALIADLKNYRTLQPVEARGGGTGYRFRKFLRRRRLAVSAGAAAFVALGVALGVTLIQYNRAETARAYAVARFDQARDLSNQVIFDVYDEIAQTPGTLEARTNLANIVRDYVTELAADPNAPDDILLDVGIQATRLSDVYGGLGLANLGDTETSYALLIEAENALGRLLERSPDNVAAIDEMIWVKRLKTNQELTYHLDTPTARQTNEEALALAEASVALPGAEETLILNRLWNARTDRLKILMAEADADIALTEVEAFRQELETPAMLERIRNPESKIAYFASQHGEILLEVDEPADAVAPLTQAMEGYQAFVAEDPDNYYNLVQVLRVAGLLSLAHSRAGNGDLALATAGQALDVARRLRSLDPSDAAAVGFVATQLEALALAEAEYGRPSNARRDIGEAVGLWRGLAADFPDNAGHRRDLASALRASANVHEALGDRAGQCRALGDATQVLATLVADDTLTDYEREGVMAEVQADRASAGCA